MRNVLFVVYYFPPMGASGVQRPLKFIKYLRQFGWNPIVITPNPGAYQRFDYSLQTELEKLDIEIHRVDAKTPFHIVGKSARKIDYIPDSLARIFRGISSFFWLPDNKIGWIEPAVEKSREIIHNKNINLIYSTAPPYSNHLIAKQLKEEFGLPVILDFRDDWLESHLIHYPTRWHRNKMAKIEQDCLLASDAIVTINKKMKESFESRYKNNPVYVIPQGYDPDDFILFKEDKLNESDSNHKLKFMYSGIFYDENQPDSFLKGLALFFKKYPDLKNEIEIWFQGGLEKRHLDLVERLGLKGILKNLGYLPHKQAVVNLLKMDVLWFIVGKYKNYQYVTTGKFFEYIATKKPILGLVKKSIIFDYLSDYQASYIADPYDVESIVEQIQLIFESWKNGKLKNANEGFIEQFNRKKLTSELCNIFEHSLPE